MATLRMPRWLRRRDRDPTRSMTMVEHLEELRRRGFISLIAIVVAGIAGWVLYTPVLNFILGPLQTACLKLPLDQRSSPKCDQLFNFGVVGPFLIHLKVALYV